MEGEIRNVNDGVCVNFIHRCKCRVKANCYFFTSHLLNCLRLWVGDFAFTLGSLDKYVY